MNRRQYLAAGLSAVGAAFAGCMSELNQMPDQQQPSTSCGRNYTPCPDIDYSPSDPSVGESVIFDASGSLKPKQRTDEKLFYRWRAGENTTVSVPDGSYYIASGETFTHAFQTPGRHAVEVLVTTGSNIGYREEQFPNIGFGWKDSDEVAQESQQVNIEDPIGGGDNSAVVSDESLVVDSDILSLQLRSERTIVDLGNPAVLTFSATALITADDPVNIQLIIEAPSGVSVGGTAFIESGIGQYTTDFTLDPGRSEGLRIELNANEPGEYNVTGRAVYYEGNNNEDAEIESISIPIRIRENE